jgi:exodeoxyribonuclease VII small subunit
VTAEPGESPRRSPARRAPAAARAAGEQAAAAQAGGPQPAAEIPYERARDELTEVVRKLEGGGLTLEQSLELWERGERLADICSQWLEGARARLAAALPPREDPGGPPAPF